MEFVFGFFIVLIVIVAVVMVVIFYYLRKGYRFLTRVARGDLSEEEFQRMSNKYYYKEKKNDGPQFDKDYFKGESNSSRQKQQQRTTARTTKTADGCTIIDNRHPDQINKKIFAQDEGEYVEFTEK